MAGKLILIVEDERELAEVVREVLEAEGHRMAVAPDGKSALTLLDEFSPDLVLTDIMLPVMDGLEFLQHFNKRPEPRPPVIAMSALKPYLEEAKKLGVVAILPKPFDIDRLLSTVDEVLKGASPKEPAPAAEPDETARLRAIFELKLDQPSAERALDEFARWTAGVFEVPICMVSIVTANDQVWTAQSGLPEKLVKKGKTPREESFCTHAVAARSALVVHDAGTNPFFEENPFVLEWGIRFYAGVPLMTRRGEAVGTLCLMDYEPRRFSYFDLELLGVLSRRVLSELDWREHQLRPELPPSSFRYLSYVDEDLKVFGRQALLESLRVMACRSAERDQPLSVVAVSTSEPPRDVVDRLTGAFPQALIGRLDRDRFGLVVPGMPSEEAAEKVKEHCGPLELAAEDVRTPLSTDSVLNRVEAALDSASPPGVTPQA